MYHLLAPIAQLILGRRNISPATWTFVLQWRPYNRLCRTAGQLERSLALPVIDETLANLPESALNAFGCALNFNNSLG